MSLNQVEITDFSGGLNTNDAPFAIDNASLTVAQDVLFDEDGRVSRRKGLDWVDDKGTSGVFTGKIICASRHSYGANSGILFVIYDSPNTEFWFMIEGSDTGCKFLEIPVETKRGHITGGWSAPTKSKNSETLNSKYDTSVVVTDSISFAFKYNSGGFSPEYVAGPLVNQEDPATDIFKDLSADIQASDFSGKYQVCFDYDDGVTSHDRSIEITYISGGQSLVGTKRTSNTTRTLTDSMYGDENLKYVATTDLYTFVAGVGSLPQHIFWSGNRQYVDGGQDSHLWNWYDREHIVDEETNYITWLSNLNGNLVVFKQGSIFIVKPIGAPEDWKKDPISQDIGCPDGRSVAYYGQGLIFANKEGVYSLDGYQVKKISDSIESTYKSYTTGVEEGDIRLIGYVVEGHYILSIIDNSTGDMDACFCINLSTGAWSTLTNLPIHTTSLSTAGSSNWGYYKSASNQFKIVRLNTMFKETSSIYRDQVGTGPRFMIETARINNQDIFRMKSWKQLVFNYIAEIGSGTTPSLKVKYVTGLGQDHDYSTASTVTALPGVVSVLPNTDTQVQRRRFAAHSPAIGIRIEEDNTLGEFDKITINGIYIGYKNMRPGRPF